MKTFEEELWDYLKKKAHPTKETAEIYNAVIRKVKKYYIYQGEPITKCDACGLPITADQENVGHECDLHKECAEI